MRKIQWFNQDPKGPGWLADLGLKKGALVEVEGHTYRYNTERGGLDHVLEPIEPPLSSRYMAPTNRPN